MKIVYEKLNFMILKESSWSLLAILEKHGKV